jgi:hypothetical protein
MATTTTNFGWDIPQSTDLVKDGATAIAALGQDIDTALVDLKGGTTGQVLAKATNTDLDFSWVAQDDSNAIQNAIVDAKGDLIGATAADTPARLAVGTNGQVLTADSTAATGLAWATPSGSTFTGVSLYNSAAQNIANNTDTIVLFDTEVFDTNTFHSTSSNTGRITIPSGQDGYYEFNCSVQFQNLSGGNRRVQLYKNGAAMTGNIGYQIENGGGYTSIKFTAVFSAVATDYFTMIAFADPGSSCNLEQAGTSFQAIKVG